MKYPEFAQRILSYAMTTGIQFSDSHRYQNLKPIGLPDTRGFTPHLRTIMLEAEENPDPANKWLIHDLLHILFYDFAYLNLGEEAFKERERFYEVHLASEAFAVLSLDYHILSQTKGAGLAVEFNQADWNHYRTINPMLPDYRSEDFVKLIVDLYLSGNRSPFQVRKSDILYDEWVGHEQRYSDKQRLYIAQWRADLEETPFDGNIPSIENSFIFEAVIELLSLVLGSEKHWKSYVTNINVLPNNYFKQFKKYKSKSETFDYRFTDVQGVSEEIWKQDLSLAKAPTASSLFLFWQLVTSANQWSPEDVRLFSELQKSANSLEVDLKLWQKTHELLLQKKWSMSYDENLKCAFFLP